MGEELKRVSRHRGAFIRTSVWNPGVSQRLSTLELYEGLSKEFVALRTVTRDLEGRLAAADLHCRALRTRQVGKGG